MLDESSCSDCKLEIIERRWTQLLLKWINTCIKPGDLKHLNVNILMDIVNKYKEEICRDELDIALMNCEDVESFIKYKFPILRLRNLCELKDYPKKLYIMTSMLLYYCCINSQNGVVDADIYRKLDKEEQIAILRFCEALTDMEATINNVDSAIKTAICSQNPNREDDVFELPSDSSKQYSSFISDHKEVRRAPILQFKSSITVLPSVITEASISKSTFDEGSDSSELRTFFGRDVTTTSFSQGMKREAHDLQRDESEDSNQTCSMQQNDSNSTDRRNQQASKESDHSYQSDCGCTRCNEAVRCCGDPGCTKDISDDPCKNGKSQGKGSNRFKWILFALICSCLFLILITTLSTIPLWMHKDTKIKLIQKLTEEESLKLTDWAWQCRKNFCHKVFHPTTNISLYTSLSRCTLLCAGPQLWPHPIGYTYFSKTIVAISTKKLEYKFQSIPSETVHRYVAEAFKLFLNDLARLEKIDTKSINRNRDLPVNRMIISVDVESDADPRLRINTDEGYMLKVETKQNQVFIKVSGVSFCGVRHGFETLSQLILLDQSTGYLITLSSMIIKDAPSYKYRGLMIDTGRNYIPVVDLLKTVDAMATCKLNTFHWRISDVTSFPLDLIKLPQFLEYGPYDRSMVYTKEDVKMIVNRAGVRGIRVLIEVAAPGPVGRPWSWLSSATCPRKNNNFTCDNVLCNRLSMQDSVFDVLETIYSEIIEMTNVDDIFHLSDGVFSMTNCYYLFDDREGFLDKALFRLKMANKGFLPKLPIVWYTSHLMRDYEAKTWDRLGVQIDVWDTNPTQPYLSKFRVIHSSKWDLSCEIRKQRCTRYRTWQQMYSWKSWKNVDVFTIEGGESILWTDLVDSSNLDYHLWPRAAAVAERLWSDVVADGSATRHVYMRLDNHRWRMLLRGIKVQPIWPAWCSFNPSSCLENVH